MVPDNGSYGIRLIRMPCACVNASLKKNISSLFDMVLGVKKFVLKKENILFH